MPFFENEGAINIDIKEIELELLQKIPLMNEKESDFLVSVVKISIQSFIEKLEKFLFTEFQFNRITEQKYQKSIDYLKECKGSEITSMMKKVKEMLNL